VFRFFSPRKKIPWRQEGHPTYKNCPTPYFGQPKQGNRPSRSYERKTDALHMTAFRLEPEVKPMMKTMII